MVLAIVFFGPIIASLFFTVLYTVKMTMSSSNILKLLIKITLINAILFAVASVNLLHFEKDGIGQFIGISVYVGCLVIFTILSGTVGFILKKQ